MLHSAELETLFVFENQLSARRRFKFVESIAEAMFMYITVCVCV